MASVMAEVTSLGVRIEIPASVVRELGWTGDQRLTVTPVGGQLRLEPELTLVESLQAQALAYLARCVGDAVAVSQPRAAAEGWELTVSLLPEGTALGVLRFDADGRLIIGRSTPVAEMHRVADAA